MQTVVQTAAFLRQAHQEGMTEDEVRVAVDMVASNPLGGDMIVGSGGMRKLRVPGKGRGKSGGYRVVTYFAGSARQRSWWPYSRRARGRTSQTLRSTPSGV